MSSTTSSVDLKTAEDHLMRFLAVEGLSGQEKAIGDAVCDELKKVGVPASAVRLRFGLYDPVSGLRLPIGSLPPAAALRFKLADHDPALIAPTK